MSNVIHLRNKRKQKNNKNATTMKFLLIAALVLVIILTVATRVFRVQLYDVEGNRLYTDDEVLQLLDIHKNTNMMKVYMNVNKYRKASPYIEDIEISYLNYNKVHLKVIEKQIIGYLLYMGQYLCIDKDGYIVDHVDPKNLEDKIAIIEGVTSDALVIGEKINIPEDIIHNCYLFHKAEVKYGIDIDRLKFKNNRTDNITIVIHKTMIEFGDMNFFNEKIQTIIEILPQIPQNESGTLYLGNNGKTSYYKKNLEQN